MSILTTEQAIQVMNDTSRPLLEREQAMHQLKDGSLRRPQSSS